MQPNASPAFSNHYAQKSVHGRIKRARLDRAGKTPKRTEIILAPAPGCAAPLWLTKPRYVRARTRRAGRLFCAKHEENGAGSIRSNECVAGGGGGVICAGNLFGNAIELPQ